MRFQDPPSHVLRRGRAAAAQQFQQHHWLIGVAHAHPLGDERAQAKEGSRGAGGHGVMVAAAGRPGQGWFWAARQAGAPAEIPSGLGVGVGMMRLQPTRLRVWLCRLSPYPTPRPPGNCSRSARGVVPIAIDGDAVQNGAMAVPATQETSLSQRLQGAREEVLAVAHRHGARNLRIYGSVARGQDRPGSDLDLLVDLERGCSLLEVIALRQELEALLNCQVDLAEAAQLHPLIRDQIIAQAKAL